MHSTNIQKTASQWARRFAVCACVLVSPVAVAGNVDSDSRVVDGRVQLLLTNPNPSIPVTLERVEVPVSLVHKKKGVVEAAEIRVVPASGVVGAPTIIDLGSVEDVFNGGGEANETVAVLKETTTVGMKKCLTRHTPVTVLLRVADATVKLMRAVPSTFCHARAD
jgi:hypothetical protein